MKKNPADYTDEELAVTAQAGLQGQQAIVESNRRLRDTLTQQTHTTNRLTKWILCFTVVLAVLTAAQVTVIVLQFID